ncbi:hypothetical protein NB636_04385 [Oxalobacter aliiformigenes]|nr:hypothetical protein [Oxalobacter aliiformigenes]MCZ4065015.1 hypothetical protein [Oxalobacter aliiformigenes]WAW00086.1 hypothetical protein NB636_04385 [Oxalobacter aliiformigenes]
MERTLRADILKNRQTTAIKPSGRYRQMVRINPRQKYLFFRFRLRHA